MHPFRNKSSFYSEDLLALRHPLPAVRCCLFNISVATHHTVGCSSIRNPKTRPAVVTGTHLSWNAEDNMYKVSSALLLLRFVVGCIVKDEDVTSTLIMLTSALVCFYSLTFCVDCT